jgi:hypothetical protein
VKLRSAHNGARVWLRGTAGWMKGAGARGIDGFKPQVPVVGVGRHRRHDVCKCPEVRARVCQSPPHTRPAVCMRPQRRSLLSRSAAAGPPRAPGRAAAFALPPQGQLAPMPLLPGPGAMGGRGDPRSRCRCGRGEPSPGAGVEVLQPAAHTHTAQRVEQQQGVIVPARGCHSEATSGRQAPRAERPAAASNGGADSDGAADSDGGIHRSDAAHRLDEDSLLRV